MRILILGATGLSGTAMTLAALDRGHDVIGVHRGTTDTLPEHPNLVDYVHDRSDGHHALQARGPYDAVIDVSALVPAWAADAVRTLDVDAPHWVQLSSVSAYANQSLRGVREDAPLAAFDDPELELRVTTDMNVPFDYAWYNPAKAACERALMEASSRWSRATILRPTLITGAHDATMRAPWWLHRIMRGGAPIVAPPASDPVQIIDARDIARVALDAVEQQVAGVFNMAPRMDEQTIGSLVAACREVAVERGCAPADVVHVPHSALREAGIECWNDLPAWIEPGIGYDAMTGADATLLHDTFAFRAAPLTDTFRTVADWLESCDGRIDVPVRLDDERAARARTCAATSS